MKKSKLLLFALLGLSLSFASCSKEDDPTVEKPQPTVSFSWKAAGTSYTEGDGAVQAGDALTFKLNATPASGEKIKRYKILTEFVGSGITGVILDTTYKSGQSALSNLEFDYTVGSLAGKYKLSAYVEQENGASKTAFFTLTVTNSGTIRTEALTFGAQDNPVVGSFLTEDYSIIFLGEANAAPESVELLYYYGNTNKATLSSPDDSQAPQVYASIANWSTRRTTKFKKVTGFDFDNATAASIDAAKGNFPSGFYSAEKNFAKGDVTIFVTQSGKYGAIKIADFTSGPSAASGTLTIDMKIVE